MYGFWLQHADAVGVAIILLVATLIGWLRLSSRHEEELRLVRRTLRNQHREELRSHRARTKALQILLHHASVRRGYTLSDAYINTTVAEVPDPNTPVFWSGA